MKKDLFALIYHDYLDPMIVDYSKSNHKTIENHWINVSHINLTISLLKAITMSKNHFSESRNDVGTCLILSF